MPQARPCRVGYVVKRYPRYSETFVVNEILAHEAAGCQIDIFALRPPADTHFQDRISRVRAAVSYLPNSPLKSVDFWATVKQATDTLPDFWESFEMACGEDVVDVHQAIRLALEVRQKNITHLHAHFATSATSVARMAASFAGVPYSFTAHAKDIFHESIDRDDLRRKLADAAAVVTVSDFNLTYLREEFGECAANVGRVYNGLDLQEFPFSMPVNRARRVVSVGRLVEKKGFHVLVDACAIMAERGVDFACDIIGGGELEQQLQQQIARLGLHNQVKLLGPRPQQEVIECLRKSCVFAAPCVVGEDGNRDGLPTVLLESMALGTPCVSTDVTGIPEVVRHNETGVIVGQHNAAELADAIERLLHHEDLRKSLASEARSLIVAEFAVHGNAAQIRELFRGAGFPNGGKTLRVGDHGTGCRTTLAAAPPHESLC